MTAPATTGRVVSLDVYRGLVLLILIPDVFSGFSFYRLHEAMPSSATWAFLTRWFSHVHWTGASIWDFIQPSFMFLAAVAMPFSVAARLRSGESRAQITGHAMLRIVALFVLGLLVLLPIGTYLDEAWPLVIIAAGFPLTALLGKSLGDRTKRVQLAWTVLLVGIGLAALCLNIRQLGNYEFTGIFSQLALSSLIAYWFIGRSRRVQAAAAGIILLATWLLYALYPIVPSPGDPELSGFFAHWNRNANVGSVFETWFMNLLPRAAPFQMNEVGVVSLNFLPTAATMIFGIMAGEVLMSGDSPARVRRTLLFAGAAGTVAGLVLGWLICPMVKLLWTPSWTLFSTGICALILCGLHYLCEGRARARWMMALVILGSNSVLLYTLAVRYRWRFTTLPPRLTGTDWYAGPYGPLWESLVFLLMMWALAWALYRARLLVRL